MANTAWASNHDGSLNSFRRVQGNLTVDLIMVRREDFDTCAVEESAAQVKARNARQFSYFPVADAKGRILGLYDAERWFRREAPESKIEGDFEPLSEDILIGADASIVEFIMQADSHPTNLVVSGSRIEGLVNLSDIQQLPARAAIFTLITSLEMAMSLTISHHWQDGNGWIAHLSDNRRDRMLNEIKQAKQRDNFVSELAFTQIHDKACIIGREGLLGRSRTRIEASFRTIGELRDSVAHSNEYAATPDDAKMVCRVVRDIYEIKAELLKVIETESG